MGSFPDSRDPVALAALSRETRIERFDMPDSERSAVRAAARGVRVLVADDDAALRMFYVCLIRKITGVSSVVAAEDGAAAERLPRRPPLHRPAFHPDNPRPAGGA